MTDQFLGTEVSESEDSGEDDQTEDGDADQPNHERAERDRHCPRTVRIN